MTDGLLLDTHAQVWMQAGRVLASEAMERVLSAADADALYLSDVSIWELGVAQTKRNVSQRPRLNGLTPSEWIERFAMRFLVKLLALTAEVLAEAALVPGVLGYGDPGDCFIIATARVHNLHLMTHDRRILDLAAARPTYLTAIPC